MWTSALKSFTSNITSHYKIADQPSSQAGPWKIFDAKNKTTGKVVSVFVFDKKSLESQGGGLGGRTNAASLKKAHEEVVERLKREASSLARLRHPSILELAEPVEDTRSGGLMFATEPVTASLDGLLREKDDQERSSGVGGRSSRHVVDGPDGKRRREVEIDQLEIQKGLLQIGQGLEFLHDSAGLVHGNLTPEAIFVNAKSDWKISGLGFSGKNEESKTAMAASLPPIPLSEILDHDHRLPRSVQLNIDYASPDFVIDKTVTPAADMFSLGLLVVALFNSPHQSPLETNMSISTYKRLFASSSTTPSQSNNFLSSTPLPKDVTSLLPRLIARRSQQRLSAKDFQAAQFFDNILVATIRFLESLPAKTPNEKTMFLRGLPRILNQFPKTVLEKKVLPALLEEMKDKELISLVLQNVFKIISIMPSGKRAFTEKIIPKLREIFLTPPVGAASKTATAPSPEKDSAKAAGLMILLENIETITENTNGKEFEQDIWPIIRISMESPAHALVDAAMRTLRVMLSILDFPTIKNDVFPVIAAVFSKTNSLGIKIRGLEALQTLCGGTPGEDDASDGLDGFSAAPAKKKQSSAILDKYTIQEKVIPLLKGIKTKEPAVMMAALEVFKEVGRIADADFLATDAMPILWSFSLGPLLNLPQFQAFMTVIQTYQTRIVAEQTRKLQDLSATQAPVASRTEFMSFARVTPANGIESGPTVGEADFESLVLGRFEPKPLSDNVTDALDGWTSSNPPGMSSPGIAVSTNSQPATQAPTFSWSSAAPQPQSRPNLAAPLSSFRTITPDQTLGAYSTLQPSAQSQPYQPAFTSQALQQAQVGASPFTGTATQPSISPVSSAWPTSSSQVWSTSLASPLSAGQASANPWATAAQPQQPALNSVFSQGSSFPSRPAQPSAFSIAPPPASPYNAFAIAPPPANTSRQSGFNNTGAFAGLGMAQQQARAQPPQQQQQQQPQKSGMDKYASLL